MEPSYAPQRLTQLLAWAFIFTAWLVAMSVAANDIPPVPHADIRPIVAQEKDRR